MSEVKPVNAWAVVGPDRVIDMRLIFPREDSALHFSKKSPQKYVEAITITYGHAQA
jgi:hypothetical protein